MICRVIELKKKEDLSVEWLASILDRLQTASEFAKTGFEMGHVSADEYAIAKAAYENMRKKYLERRSRRDNQ